MRKLREMKGKAQKKKIVYFFLKITVKFVSSLNFVYLKVKILFIYNFK